MESLILIMVLATSSSVHSGSASIVVEFDNKQACMNAGNSLMKDAINRGNFVLTWGCFSKQ